MLGQEDESESPSLEDQLGESCYCPGDEYARFVPSLAKAITDVARLKSREAEIYRVPVERQADLPDVTVLQGIEKFSQYTRDQLVQITDSDLVALAIEAQINVAKAQELNQETIATQNQTYYQLKEEMEEFSQNMTERRTTVSTNQDAIRDGSGNKRRKRDGFYTYLTL